MLLGITTAEDNAAVQLNELINLCKMVQYVCAYFSVQLPAHGVPAEFIVVGKELPNGASGR